MGLCNVCERVSIFEQGQAWLKGAWAILAAASAYLFKGLRGK